MPFAKMTERPRRPQSSVAKQSTLLSAIAALTEITLVPTTQSQDQAVCPLARSLTLAWITLRLYYQFVCFSFGVSTLGLPPRLSYPRGTLL